jgi:glycosyltransferase involved in cell wall biosynthesis
VKVLNVIQQLDSHLGGGTVERTLQMSRHLVRQGVACTILTMETGLTAERIRTMEGVEVVAFPCLNRRYFIPLFSLSRIRELVQKVNVVHLMNQWTVLNALVYLEVRRQGKPYVICPAGALPLTGRSRLLKKIYNFVIGKAIVRNADLMIAVSDNEVPEYLRYGGKAERVAVIPNGIERQNFAAGNRNGFLTRHGLPDRPLILFVGRLNPIKGPDLLLRAFLALDRQYSNWQLVLVGPDEGLRKELEMLAASSNAQGRVFFPGYLGGTEKSDAYYAAELLVIPSRQEAMSIVALEAGICGTPVLLTDQCGFPEVESSAGGLVVKATAGSLQAGLEKIMALEPAERTAMGNRLQALVESEYLWEAVIKRLIAIYDELLETGGGSEVRSDLPVG